MNFLSVALGLLLLSTPAFAGQPWIFGTGEAVNLTNGTAYKNGVKNIAGSLNPSSTAVNAPSGSMYFSTSGTIYVKQDAGLTTNWLPLGIATTGSLTTINGQSGPNVNIAAGTSGSDFAVSASSNTITLNLPTASAIARGALSSGDWTLFNNKEPAITAGTTSQYWRGDKSWQTLDKAAVGLSNVDNTSDTSKPISTATQAALDLKADQTSLDTTNSAVALKADQSSLNTTNSNVTANTTAIAGKIDGVASSVDSELVLFSGTTGKASKRATGSGYAKLTSGVLSTSATVATSDLSGQVALANGGTNKNMTAVSGGVVYTDADSQEVSAAGTSGQVLQSNGTSAPSFVNKSISGKAQNKTAVTLEEIQVPNNQLTLVTGSKYLAETGNKNILDDASFEGSNQTSAWTLTGGSYVSDNTPIDGAFNALIQATASSFAISQDSTLYASQFADGVQGLASIRVRTSVTSTPIYVCYRQAGNSGSISNGCVQVQANGKWGLYKVPFILGATSNGIIVHSNGTVITGDVELDDAFVGAVDLKQDIPVGNVQQSTISTTNLAAISSGTIVNTGSTVSNLYTINAANITINRKSKVIVTLSASLTTTDLPVSITTAGSVGYTCIDRGRGTSAAFYASCTITADLIAGDTITFSSIASAANTININATETVGASFYSATNADTDWAACGHTTSDFTGFGTVTNIETQCKREGADLLMRGKFTAGTSTATEARLALKLNGTSLTSAGSSVIGSIQLAGDVVKNNQSATYFRNNTLIEPSVTYITFGSQTSTTNGLTKANGNDIASAGIVSITARVPINGWTNSNVIIGSFNEVMTTPGVTKPVEYSADISSTDVVSNETSDFINGNCTNATTGKATCTFNSGKFASTPKCYFEEIATGSGNANIDCDYESISSSAVTVFCKQGGTSIDWAFYMKCEGQAP